jgi:hypothetical protein
MNFELLWIDVLLIALLFVMATVAIAGRIRRSWRRWLVWCVCVLIPLGILGGLFATAITFTYANDWAQAMGSLVIGYVIGTAVILWKASRRATGDRPAAASWRRVPLLVGWLVALVVGYTTLINMDLALRARCALLSNQLSTLYVAMTPAITSDSQNAAKLYERAYQQLHDDNLEEKINNPPTGNGVIFDPNEPATLAFLAHDAPTIALLRTAAAMPACRFEKDLSVTMDLEGLNDARNAANVLKLDAMEQIAHGHGAPAITDAGAIFAMSRQIGRRPLLVSALVGIGIDALACKTLEEALPVVSRREELNSLHMELLTPFGQVFQQSLWGEERFGLMCYGNLPDNQPGSKLSELPLENLLTSGGASGAMLRVLFLNVDRYLILMKNLQDSAVKPYYQVRGHLLDAQGSKPSSDIMTAILAPSLARCFETVARDETEESCARAGVAMTRYRLDHGKFPPSLDELVPVYLDAIPIDFLNGHALRLAIKKNQWIVYGIGPDGIDHGGVGDEDTGKGDILFTLISGQKILPATDPDLR